MVYRIYVEKKIPLTHEADALFSDICSFLGITSLARLRIINRYDVEGISERLFLQTVRTVFSEPPQDECFSELDTDGASVFAVEYLPGQFDVRADSAEQCIQIISLGERPTVKSAKVYMLYGKLTPEETEKIKKYVINPVEARQASLGKPDSLKADYAVPDDVKILTGFTKSDEKALGKFISEYGLAMDLADIVFCRDYFISEKRDPTITEIRMLDTYWSDHCRHTTFQTVIDEVSFSDPLTEKAYNRYMQTRKALGRKKPVCLMDIATLAAKYLKAEGKLTKLDESDEINACTVKTSVTTDGRTEPWLLLFKNETHNHPTEIEPFGGAATCIGGAIRDPLSGRAYVYGAMRLTGAANPLAPVSETLTGKLPQRKLVTGAAAGYSSYGNQIGLATGIVDEIYHPGYAAKHMEVGAVIAAVPEKNVKRCAPSEGDLVILLGGRTGRDGCGGATGSSKSHDLGSLESCGAEVQKGNAPEERKLQRFFRNPEASLMIKRCNDFGAGGVSVAIGELAEGLRINLDKVPKKYAGLDGTELAISESQERMAVVVSPSDAGKFLSLAEKENLEATVVAEVTDNNRLTMSWRGKDIVDISRDFLDCSGAEKHIKIAAPAPEKPEKADKTDFTESMLALAADINICSRQGLSERFDSTIGAGTVIMPLGGKYQKTPSQAMVQKFPVMSGHTDDCSVMAWGFNPSVSEKSPYRGAYFAVVESVAKLIASGADREDTYLSLQEYFEKPGEDPTRWGQPLSALLGAFSAQLDLGIGAIGGKDSMSGSFEKLDVPPTLISFAVTTAKTGDIISDDFKSPGNTVVLIKPEYDENGIPVPSSLLNVFDTVSLLCKKGEVSSAYALSYGGIAEAVMKMCFGNEVGFEFSQSDMNGLFEYLGGAFLIEVKTDVKVGKKLGIITKEPEIRLGGEAIRLSELLHAWERKLDPVYQCAAKPVKKAPDTLSYESRSSASPAIRVAKPKVLIPVFPGTNCEYDTKKAFDFAGANAEIFVINNLSGDAIASSAEEFAKKLSETQIIFIPGGFSGGDEPDGSGKFITAFFRCPQVKEQTGILLDSRGGLIGGICNGFQALIKLGLLPYGKILDSEENSPTLTFNTIGRHVSRLVRTRVSSVLSPWLARTNVGDVFTVPVSHGEGRFICPDAELKNLISAGQIATQYVDFENLASRFVPFNPNGSVFAVEGITSPDGRVFGKMGHSERIGNDLYKNVPGNYDMNLFSSAVSYFSK